MTGKIYLNLKDWSHHPNGIACKLLQKRCCTIHCCPTFEFTGAARLHRAASGGM